MVDQIMADWVESGAVILAAVAALFYFDRGHLSIPGSWIIGREAVAGGVTLSFLP
jgi:hypothetical protein